MVTKYSWLRLVFIFFSGIVLLFVLAPLLRLILAPGLSGLIEAASDQQVSQSIFRTLGIAMSTTVIAGFITVPFAWLMARSRFKLKSVINAIIDLPVMIPHSAAGIALLGIINRESVLGQWASSIGISFIDQPAGIAIAMAFVSLPFLYNASRDAFEAQTGLYEKAALNLGASQWQTFYLVSLPMAAKGILSGYVMMFGRAMSEFGAIVIIAYHPMVTPVMIFDRFNAFGLKSAQGIAALFVLISLIVFISLRLLAKRQSDARN
ncbi:MAG: ABC transporter permease [Bacteroidales bacterium]|jgi:molybdate/tungstate transport system permease protein|nr:ABC transporter permease [Bacteroidales bacterium]